MNKKVLVVVGPTATGKTAVGIQLAQLFDGEIISGDSQQVYRGLDIGTAKATVAERQRAVHHLIDIRALDEAFSAHDFVNAANVAIAEILSRQKLPILVGGTGLYIQALLEGYHLGGSGDHDKMLALRAELEQLTDEELFEKAAHLPIPELNRRRAIRGLELAAFGSGDNIGSPYDFCLIGLDLPREKLYERINARVDSMLAAGLLDEAQLLYEQFPKVQAAKAIGYKEFFPYFAGESTLEAAVAQVKQNSRRYAKRQLTWFRNRMAVDFLNIDAPDYPENVIIKTREFLNEEKR